MGLMTAITGKSRFERKLEKRQKLVYEKAVTISSTIVKEGWVNIQDAKDYANLISALGSAYDINQFSTHYVRAQLDYHPKWTTDSNYESESQIIVPHLLAGFNVIKEHIDSPESAAKLMILIFHEHIGLHETEEYIKNMFKTCPLFGLFRVYEDLTSDSLRLLKALLRYLSSRSNIEHDPDFYDQIIDFIVANRPPIWRDPISEARRE